MSESTTPTLSPEEKKQKQLNLFNSMNTFSRLSKTIVQDLVNNRKESVLFQRYSKEEVIKFLSKPQASEKQIRIMSRFLHDNSSQYKRLCKYMSRLPTMDYIISPYNLSPKYNKNSFLVNYYKVVNLLEKMNIKHEFAKIFDICWYEDIFCGLYFETDDSFSIVHVNADYCKISSIEDGCFKYSLDFTYFNDRLYLLDSYGDKIKQMYLNYVGYTSEDAKGKKKKIKGDSNLRWQEPPNQICLKINEDQPLYALPPFSAVFPDILNLEDYKLLKKSGEMLKNYKILGMEIPLNDEGNFAIDEDIVEKFYNQACNNIASGVGIIVSPMKISQYSFQNSSTAETDAVNAAELEVWSTAGTNSLLFGMGDNPSSSALEISTKNDEVLAFSLLRQVGRWINKYIKNLNLPYDFRVEFLETSIYNRQNVFDMYFKAGQAGVPCKMAIGASLGLSPSTIINMATLENDILEMRDTLYSEPLLSSSTMSPDSQGGRPTNASQGKTVTDGTETQQDNGSNTDNR